MNGFKFTKMHGTGNNFVVFTDFEEKYKDLSKVAQALCNRNFGVGADGILVVRNSSIADIQMIIINSDGSYAEMCGNGIRCFARFVYEEGIVRKPEITIETGDGVKTAYLIINSGKVEEVKINMGIPSFNPKDVPALSEEEVNDKVVSIKGKEYKLTSLLMGVPHTIVLDNEERYETSEGALIEKYELFPKGTNVDFCKVISEDEINVRTWERGAAATLSCGTGVCASVSALYKKKLINSKVKVNVPGGVLHIEVTDKGVYMSGEAVYVYKGELLELEI